MRLPAISFNVSNVAPAFGGRIQAPGVTGSYLNTATSILGMGPGFLGNGPSVDQGAGGGGSSGGGGSGSRNPGPPGGSGGTGGFAGGAGTVGGQGSALACRKLTTPPPPDADDALVKRPPSPDDGAAGLNDGSTPVLTLNMTAISLCLGGPTTIPPSRLKGGPTCPKLP